MINLFVYGSLMSGLSAHHFIQAGTFLGVCRTAPRYALVRWHGYPGLVDGERAIFGELYCISPQLLKVLDQFEGVPIHYLRREISLSSGDVAMGYSLQPDAQAISQAIPAICWRRYLYGDS